MIQREAKSKVLIAGVSGLVGLAAARAFLSQGWDVVGVSRRAPSGLNRATALSVDLLDPDACAACFSALGDVTHVVYAALREELGLFAGWFDSETIERNARMLRNLFDPLLPAAKGLRHVSLLHGTKAYGVHHPNLGLRGLSLPLREREPRREHPNFYFLQEDYLRERQREGSWSLTIFRPTVIYGDARGANMNPILPIAVYAALERERGRALDFPGHRNELGIAEAVDADLVAQAIAWAATSPAARDETFNLTNGDVFVWQHVWPAIAETMGMAVGEHRPVSLAEELPRREAEWAEMVETYTLDAPRSVVELVGANSLVYADAILGGMGSAGVPILNSTVKIRQAGFHACIDTEDMFRKWFGRLQQARTIPMPGP